MTVKELKAALEGVDENIEVVVSDIDTFHIPVVGAWGYMANGKFTLDIDGFVEMEKGVHIVETCICPFRIVGNKAISVNDDDLSYTLPDTKMTDEEIKAFFKDIKKMEE